LDVQYGNEDGIKKKKGTRGVLRVSEKQGADRNILEGTQNRGRNVFLPLAICKKRVAGKVWVTGLEG